MRTRRMTVLHITTLAGAVLAAVAPSARAFDSAPDMGSYPATYETGTSSYPVTYQDELNGHQGPGPGSVKTWPFHHYEPGTLGTGGATGMRFHIRGGSALAWRQGPGIGSVKTYPFQNPSPWSGIDMVR